MSFPVFEDFDVIREFKSLLALNDEVLVSVKRQNIAFRISENIRDGSFILFLLITSISGNKDNLCIFEAACTSNRRSGPLVQHNNVFFV